LILLLNSVEPKKAGQAQIWRQRATRWAQQAMKRGLVMMQEWHQPMNLSHNQSVGLDAQKGK
jgi:hypothetical protein